MRFKKNKSGEWIQPVTKGYLLKCCDCRLIHKVDFRIAYGKTQKGDRIQFRMFRGKGGETRIKTIKAVERMMMNTFSGKTLREWKELNKMYKKLETYLNK